MLTALVGKYSSRTERLITRENILCFPGTQSALFAVMICLVEAGDDVLVGDPFYATYEGVIRACGAGKIGVKFRAEHGFRMQVADLKAAITSNSRVLLLNSPHNPTGAVLSAAENAALGAVCERHNLWIISDEVYESQIFDGDFVSPIDNPRLAERSIAVSSISKSHAAPGFLSGWAVGPAELCRRIQPVSETMLFGNQQFIADMTAYALTHDLDTAARMREAYTRRARLIMEALGDIPQVKPLAPSAGMFTLLDVSATGLTGEAFTWALLDKARVAVMPGASFGDQARNYVRLSLTVPDERISEACERIARFAKSFARAQPRVARA